MKSKFIRAYEHIMKLVTEQVKGIDDKFDFRFGKNGDLMCYFSTLRNNDKFDIIANCSKDPMEFVVVGPDGDKQELSRKDFVLNYSLDYDEFEQALEKYNKENGGIENPKRNPEDTEESEKEESGTGIKSFEVQMKKDNENDPNVKMTETITVNGQAFIFSLLNDPAVDSYCEVTFDKQNEETSEIEYFKGLLDIKEKNSIIIKIIKMAENGEIIDELAKSDLVNQEPEIAERLTKAIQKMEMIVWEK